MEDYPDEEGMEDIKLDNEREHHWRMVLQDKYVGVDDKKALIHAKGWDVYINEKKNLIQSALGI